MTNSPVALEAYEVLAEAYAAIIDTKPHNAYYERPATVSLLPDVAGLQVLDAGCGPGVYAEWLANRGAKVLALDVSPKMVELARLRLGGRAEVHVADLGRPLAFLEAGFRLERILEPKPTKEFREADRRHYDELMRQPCFLCIRASK